MADEYEVTKCKETRLKVSLMGGDIGSNRFFDKMIELPCAYVALSDHDDYEGFIELSWHDPQQLEAFAHQLLDVADKLKKAREEWCVAGHPLSEQDLDLNEKSRTIWL